MFLIHLLGLFFSSTAQEQAASQCTKVETIPNHKTTFCTIKEGTGSEMVKEKSKVTVHATGFVVETGKKFWSTKDAGQKPFTYTAGVGQVITGWDKGLLGMKLGEEREVTIPADEGYGAGGFPAWGIPPNGSLRFLLEVLKMESKDEL